MITLRGFRTSLRKFASNKKSFKMPKLAMASMPQERSTAAKDPPTANAQFQQRNNANNININNNNNNKSTVTKYNQNYVYNNNNNGNNNNRSKEINRSAGGQARGGARNLMQPNLKSPLTLTKVNMSPVSQVVGAQQKVAAMAQKEKERLKASGEASKMSTAKNILGHSGIGNKMLITQQQQQQKQQQQQQQQPQLQHNKPLMKKNINSIKLVGNNNNNNNNFNMIKMAKPNSYAAAAAAATTKSSMAPTTIHNQLNRPIKSEKYDVTLMPPKNPSTVPKPFTTPFNELTVARPLMTNKSLQQRVKKSEPNNAELTSTDDNMILVTRKKNKKEKNVKRFEVPEIDKKKLELIKYDKKRPANKADPKNLLGQKIDIIEPIPRKFHSITFDVKNPGDYRAQLLNNLVVNSKPEINMAENYPKQRCQLFPIGANIRKVVKGGGGGGGVGGGVGGGEAAKLKSGKANNKIEKGQDGQTRKDKSRRSYTVYSWGLNNCKA